MTAEMDTVLFVISLSARPWSRSRRVIVSPKNTIDANRLIRWSEAEVLEVSSGKSISASYSVSARVVALTDAEPGTVFIRAKLNGFFREVMFNAFY